VLVDNGSQDNSLPIMRDLVSKDPRVRFISLSRNFGHQNGLLAGIQHTRGRAVITLDADLQHPPELIPRLLALWREGYDVVYTVKEGRQKLPVIRRILHRLFYGMVNRLSGLHLAYGQSDYRLMDRHVTGVLCRMPEKRLFLRGLVDWMGFRQTGILYQVPPRYAGQSKYSYWQLFRLGFDGVFSFSLAPMRFFFYAGLIVAFLCFSYGLYLIGGWLSIFPLGAGKYIPPGWLSVMVSLLFLGGVQMMGIGLLGEYMGRIYEQTMDRPPYIIRETSASERPGGAEPHS
jgi:glycosyltransferase involved in cell wall biosynthesis